MSVRVRRARKIEQQERQRCEKQSGERKWRKRDRRARVKEEQE